jgi:N-glycosylase/DNA lyase
MNRIEDKENRVRYSLIAYGRYIELTQVSWDTVEKSCTEEEFHELWEEYFDLNFDYGKIVRELAEGEDRFLSEASAYGNGIRILKQEPFEAMISFIISQNKNIPAIKACIEAICTRFGERKVNPRCGNISFTAFPAPRTLAEAAKEELRALKTGYRDEYILRASKAAANGDIDFDRLKSCGYKEAVATLMSIHGVGEKVANCIALYGLHHIDGFPVDVWIRRVLDEYYNGSFNKDRYHGYAGIIQQYMFYYIRNRKAA